MPFVTLSDASIRLPELVKADRRGEDVVLIQDNHPVARLLPMDEPKPAPPPGHAKDWILYIADDFDTPLEEFADYS